MYWRDHDHKNVWSLPKGRIFKKSHNPTKICQASHGLSRVGHQPLNCKLFSSIIGNSTEKSDLSKHDQKTPSLPEYEDADLCLGFCYNNGECVHVNSDLRCR